MLMNFSSNMHVGLPEAAAAAVTSQELWEQSFPIMSVWKWGVTPAGGGGGGRVRPVSR